jgi:hypothetical protein
MNIHSLPSLKGVHMLSRIAEDAAALTSMGLFLTMIALWGHFFSGV